MYGEGPLSLLLEEKHAPPAPEAIPQPDPHEGRPLLTLAELTPGRYVDTIARVDFFKVSERHDQLGTKPIYSGVLEDSTFRVPFICHKTSLPLERNGVFRIRSAYVHEFQDRSILLILTEYSRIQPVPVEDLGGYVWTPRIGGIPRPIHDVILEGVVSNIYDTSGLVKRCNKCKRLIYDVCPNGCSEGWSWDVRISSRLYDGSGSIKTIFSRHIAAKMLGRSLGEIFFLLNTKAPQAVSGFELITFHLNLPQELDVIEVVVENASCLRSRDRLMVTDGFTLAYFLLDRDLPNDAVEISRKKLDPSDPRESKILRRLIEKVIEFKIREITGKPLLHGLYLLDDPIPLYGCERAKLYLGFTVKARLLDGKVVIEASPQALVRESVWEYVKWRRGRGASANAIERMLRTYRSHVLLAPLGQLGHIEGLIFKRAGEQAVSDNDRRNLVEFWRDVYGIEVEPDETPLLKVRLMNSEQLFTYPPSTAYFDGNLLYIPAGTQRFIEMKKSSLKGRVRAVLTRALQGLSIGSQTLNLIEEEQSVDVQSLLLSDIRQKLLGRRIKARGPVIQLSDQLCFFPQRILQVS